MTVSVSPMDAAYVRSNVDCSLAALILSIIAFFRFCGTKGAASGWVFWVLSLRCGV